MHDKFGEKPPAPGKKVKFKAASGAPVWEPFGAIFSGLWEAFSAIVPVGSMMSKPKKAPKKGSANAAAKDASIAMWQAFKNYKKSHGLLSW